MILAKKLINSNNDYHKIIFLSFFAVTILKQKIIGENMKLKQKSLLSLAVISALTVLNANANDNKDNVNLNEVTVTSAAGYEQKLIDAPASISVITLEDLQKKPYGNLLDAVKDIEGVDIGESTDKSGQGTISMRGMGSDYTLVLIDGKKQNNNGDIYPNDFGGLQFANIPPLAMIERIEIVRGPMSTLYGADAMGGVINIITKKIAQEWGGSISHSKTFQTDSAWGNQDTTDISIMGPLVENKLGLSIRGSFYDKEASNPQWDTDTFNGADSSKDNTGIGGTGRTVDNQNWSLGTGLVFTPNDSHTIRFDYDIAKQKYDNTAATVGTVDSTDSLFHSSKSSKTNEYSYVPRVGYTEYQRMEREQYSLSWEADWEKGKSTVGLHHIESNNFGRSLPLSLSERERMNDVYDGIPDSKTKEVTYDDITNNDDKAFVDGLLPRPIRTLASKNTTLSAKYEIPLEDHYLVVGADYLKAEMTDGVFGMNKGQTNLSKEYNQWSLFAEDSWMITDPLTLTVGARYDDHEDFGGHISPRAYLNYAVSHNWTVKGGVSTGYKTPKTSDLYDGINHFGSQGTKPGFGNPDLKPEESLNTEIAAYYEHDDGHSFNATLFQNNFKDKIESGDAKGDIAQRWIDLGYEPTMKENVGDATINGIEIAAKYLITDNLTIKGNWTYMDSEIESDDADTNGKPLSNSPEHMYSATLEYQATAKLNTYLQYSGEKKRFNTRYETEKKSGVYKDLYYKDLSVFNLGASFKANESLTFNGRINNLFDKDFTEYNAVNEYPGRGGGTSYHYNQYSNIIAPRNVWLSATYTF